MAFSASRVSRIVRQPGSWLGASWRRPRHRPPEQDSSQDPCLPSRRRLAPAVQNALELFEAEIHGCPDSEINLVRAAALLALHADTSIDVDQAVIAPLVDLGKAFSSQATQAIPAEAPLPETMRPHALAGLLCEFFANEGFSGCSAEDYYQADNSLMNVVLAKRCGIPISLSLVYQEVARAGGLDLHGVNYPGHFLLSYGSGEDAGVLDAFSNETSLARNEKADGHVAFLTGLPAITNNAFLRRMVLNLQGVYNRDQNLASATIVAHYAKALEVAAQPPE